MYKNGQNLRLFLGGKCVAAATSCSLSVSADVQEVSTKDSEGGFAENICTGKSFTMSTEALVLDAGVSKQSADTACTYSDRYGEALNGFAFRFHSNGNEKINAQVNDYHYGITLYRDGGTEPLNMRIAESGSDAKMEYTIDESGDYAIVSATEQDFILSRADQSALLASDIIAQLKSGQPIAFSFDNVTGSRNRTSAGTLVKGQAIVSGVEISAANKNVVTYSVNMTGDGELQPETTSL